MNGPGGYAPECARSPRSRLKENEHSPRSTKKARCDYNGSDSYNTAPVSREGGNEGEQDRSGSWIAKHDPNDVLRDHNGVERSGDRKYEEVDPQVESTGVTGVGPNRTHHWDTGGPNTEVHDATNSTLAPPLPLSIAAVPPESVPVTKVVSPSNRARSALYIPDDLAEELAVALASRERAARPGCRRTHYDTAQASPRAFRISNLPDWTNEADIFRLLDTVASSARRGPPVVTSRLLLQPTKDVLTVDVARNPESSKCVGYAWLDFYSRELAVRWWQALSSLPTLCLEDCPNQLSLAWSQHGAKSHSTNLQNYHFYIGNLRPGTSQSQLTSVICQTGAPVAAVRVLNAELLGPAPLAQLAASSKGTAPTTRAAASGYSNTTATTLSTGAVPPMMSEVFERSTEPRSPQEEQRSLLTSVSLSFYEGDRFSFMNPRPDHEAAGPIGGVASLCRDSSGLTSFDNDARRWSCAFVRLEASGWTCTQLRHEYFKLRSALSVPRENDAAESSIVVRPIFGRADDFGVAAPSRPRPFRAGAASEAQVPWSSNIFVGNLSGAIREEHLRALFMPFGDLLDVRMIHSKRIAFVTLASLDLAVAALSHLEAPHLFGQRLELDWARSQHPASAGFEGQAPLGNRSVNYSFSELPIRDVEISCHTRFTQGASLHEGKSGESPAPTPDQQPSLEQAAHIHSSHDQQFWLSSLAASLDDPTAST